MMSGDTLRYSTGSPVPVTKDNPLNNLIRRLEAATSRLEDIASSSGSFEQQANGDSHGDLSAGAGLPASSSMPELTASKEGSREASTTSTLQPVSAPLPPSVEEMDELISKEVKEFLEASHGLDTLIEEQVCILQLNHTSHMLTDFEGVFSLQSLRRPEALPINNHQSEET
jgi:adenylyl cyclase-associated protein